MYSAENVAKAQTERARKKAEEEEARRKKEEEHRKQMEEEERRRREEIEKRLNGDGIEMVLYHWLCSNSFLHHYNPLSGGCKPIVNNIWTSRFSSCYVYSLL